jgi:hypothetical protein
MKYNAAMKKLLDEGKIPARMQQLPITEEGWPQLWFAGLNNEGKPDLRCADPGKRVFAVKQNRCWLCGQFLGNWKVFVLGPMCAVNRTTSEPPCHRQCAEFAVIACPFLTRPKMKRNDHKLPEGYEPPPGDAIMRNPGATVLWVCKDYTPFFTDKSRIDWLIQIGEPTEVLWYAEGKPATREQINESIDSGYPRLLASAKTGGPRSVALLQKLRKDVERWLPAA